LRTWNIAPFSGWIVLAAVGAAADDRNNACTASSSFRSCGGVARSFTEEPASILNWWCTVDSHHGFEAKACAIFSRCFEAIAARDGRKEPAMAAGRIWT
jgi:hypothetical protein